MSYTLRDYLCAVCGPFEELVERIDGRPPAEVPCATCAAPAELTVSAPAVHTLHTVGVNRGRNDPKPHHMSMDTRPLAEGQPLSEWKAERAKLWNEDRRKRVKAALE